MQITCNILALPFISQQIEWLIFMYSSNEDGSLSSFSMNKWKKESEKQWELTESEITTMKL